jgi:hypothetical protein
MNNPIFIVGLPRSGSTLWHNVITCHEGICRIGEMHYLTPWRKDFRYFCNTYVGDRTKNENIRKMVDLIFSTEKQQGLTAWFWDSELHKISSDHLKEKIYLEILKSDRSLGSIFRILIENVATHYGKNRCCVKFPVYPNHITQLLKWYPHCKIIHITRDPRATAISRTNDPGGTQTLKRKYPLLSFILQKTMIYFVVIQYYWTSIIHSKFLSHDNYALFRYEDLLANPEKVVRELCDFADIEYDDKMLAPMPGQRSSVTGEAAKGFDINAGTRWKNIISPIDRFFVTILTKRSMTKLGYDPLVHPIFHKIK